MKNFLLGLNKLGAINLENVEGAVFYPEKDIITIDFNNRKSRVLDFKNLFIETTHRYGLVIDKDNVLLADGKVEELKKFVSNFKQDNRKVKPKVGSFVDLQLCVNEDAMLTLKTAKSLKDVGGTRGIVESFEDGVYNVIVNSSTYKLPSICLKKLPRKIMCDKMYGIFEMMINKGNRPKTVFEYNYMKFMEDGAYIEYITNDRLSRFDGDFWNSELRAKFATKKKTRGVLANLFECTDSEMEEIISINSKSTLNVEILEGEDINSVFIRDNIQHGGSLSQSCMMGKDSDFFKIYEENAKVAIVRNSDGKITMRAFLWELKCDGKSKKITFLDRIYSNNDSQVSLMKAWALSKGYYTLPNQSHSSSVFTSPKGVQVNIGNYYVPLKRADYESFPYIDTMYVLVGKRLYSRAGVKVAHNTGGNIGGF